MLKFILISCCFLFSEAKTVESIYIHSVTSIEGENKPLSSYQGRKVLIVILPIEQNASSDSLLHSLDSLRNIHTDSLTIIAVPSYEDGYSQAIKENLRQWYRSILSMDVIVTEGIYTRRISGSIQHPLFKWLTDKNKNDHFNRDVSGPMDKFIIWTNGELIGVLGAQTRIGGSSVNSLLQGQ